MKQKVRSNKIKIIRVYDAPVEMVWDAWVKDDQVSVWWGPRGFTITTHSKDLKPGGYWHYTMHGPDGRDYENTTKYHEVTKNKVLVYDHGGHKDRPPLFQVTAFFTEQNGKTKLEMSMTFETPEVAEETEKFIKQAGGHGTWDRLAEYLIEKQSGKDVFVMARTFDTSISKLFEMWTKKDLLAQWLAPAGSHMNFFECEIKEGGVSFYEMKSSSTVMYGKAEYKTVSKPNLLVYRQWFTNKDGSVGRHPLAPVWPKYMRTTVDFTEETSEKTRISIVWEIDGEATKDERAVFHSAKLGMQAGWTGSLDKLEAMI